MASQAMKASSWQSCMLFNCFFFLDILFDGIKLVASEEFIQIYISAKAKR